MVDSSRFKVPFDDLQKYLEKHDILITSFVKLEKAGAITRADVEERLPNSLLKLHECLTEILINNKVIDTSQQ
jgi:hypothetical protein